MSGKQPIYSNVNRSPGKKQTQQEKKIEPLVYDEVRPPTSYSSQSRKTRTESAQGRGSAVPTAWRLAVVALGTVSLVLLLATGALGMMVLQGQCADETKNPPSANVTQNNCTVQNTVSKEEPFNKGDDRNTCQANWRCCGDNCYYFSRDSKNFDESEKFCRDRGSTLLKLEDKDELKFIQSQVSYFYWIGLSREGTRSPWTWEDKSHPTLQIDWKESIYGNCARISATKMAVSDCSKVIKFICEKKMASLAA